MRHLAILILAIVANAATACSPMVYVHGVPNLAQVSPEIYRSGQITSDEGWAYIRTLSCAGATRSDGACHPVHVIKLNFANEGSDLGAAALGFTVHELPIQPEGDQDLWDDVKSVYEGPDPGRLDEIERLLESAQPGEVWLVHCTHGQDRTGYVIGRYRVLHDGWTKDAAYNEMRAHNFHYELHGIHEAWERFKALATKPRK